VPHVAALLVASPPEAPPTTAAGSSTPTSSPFVTLQPTTGHGQIPGDASDPADFYGLAAAFVAIAVAIVVVRLAFRGRGRTHDEPRADP
jgi:hypothetical protein